jgi:hypothetical protein
MAREESYLESRKEYQFQGIKEVETDNVNHPPHYNNSPATCECGRRIECIDVTRHYSFNIGNAIKYLWRCDLKGRAVEDLKKAVWYIEDEIAKREKSP